MTVCLNICCVYKNDNTYSLAVIIHNHHKMAAKERILSKYSRIQQKWIIRNITKDFNNSYNDFNNSIQDENIYPAIDYSVFIFYNLIVNRH